MTNTSQDILETTLSTSYARFGEGELTENLRPNSTRSTSKSLMEDPNLKYKELYQRQAQLLPPNSCKLPHNLETIEHHHIAIYIALVFIMFIVVIHFMKKWRKPRNSLQLNQKPPTPVNRDGSSIQHFTININDC